MNEASSQNEEAPKVEQPGKFDRLLHNRKAMLALLFCVTGFLGIPFLWKSRAFSVGEKALWSIVISIYTSFLLWGTARIVWWSYSNVRDALAW